ncbi:MAG: hypothetical protein QM572_07915, partial [Nocardioides sp.]|uniref:hypothetical protein n=1 Tax=Nocardioides sp. TaxID=35761 RepID=UPI0039E390F0
AAEDVSADVAPGGVRDPRRSHALSGFQAGVGRARAARTPDPLRDPLRDPLDVDDALPSEARQ